MQETLAFLKPFAERFDKAFESLAALDLSGCLRVARQRRRDRQPEAHEQRQRLGRDADVTLKPLDLPGQPVEAAGEGGFAPIGAVGRQE